MIPSFLLAEWKVGHNYQLTHTKIALALDDGKVESHYTDAIAEILQHGLRDLSLVIRHIFFFWF